MQELTLVVREKISHVKIKLKRITKILVIENILCDV